MATGSNRPTKITLHGSRCQSRQAAEKGSEHLATEESKLTEDDVDIDEISAMPSSAKQRSSAARPKLTLRNVGDDGYFEIIATSPERERELELEPAEEQQIQVPMPRNKRLSRKAKDDAQVSMGLAKSGNQCFDSTTTPPAPAPEVEVEVEVDMPRSNRPSRKSKNDAKVNMALLHAQQKNRAHVLDFDDAPPDPERKLQVLRKSKATDVSHATKVSDSSPQKAGTKKRKRPKSSSNITASSTSSPTAVVETNVDEPLTSSKRKRKGRAPLSKAAARKLPKSFRPLGIREVSAEEKPGVVKHVLLLPIIEPPRASDRNRKHTLERNHSPKRSKATVEPIDDANPDRRAATVIVEYVNDVNSDRAARRKTRAKVVVEYVIDANPDNPATRKTRAKVVAEDVDDASPDRRAASSKKRATASFPNGTPSTSQSQTVMMHRKGDGVTAEEEKNTEEEVVVPQVFKNKETVLPLRQEISVDEVRADTDIQEVSTPDHKDDTKSAADAGHEQANQSPTAEQKPLRKRRKFSPKEPAPRRYSTRAKRLPDYVDNRELPKAEAPVGAVNATYVNTDKVPAKPSSRKPAIHKGKVKPLRPSRERNNQLIHLLPGAATSTKLPAEAPVGVTAGDAHAILPSKAKRKQVTREKKAIPKPARSVGRQVGTSNPPLLNRVTSTGNDGDEEADADILLASSKWQRKLNYITKENKFYQEQLEQKDRNNEEQLEQKDRNYQEQLEQKDRNHQEQLKQKDRNYQEQLKQKDRKISFLEAEISILGGDENPRTEEC